MALDAQTRTLLTAVARRAAEEHDGSAYEILEAVGEFAAERGVAAGADELEPLADAAAVEHTAVRFVAEGYATFEEVCEEVREAIEEEEEIALDAAAVREITAAAWRAQLQAQLAWPAETDNDRLTRAFAALEQQGVLAREDFTCCNSCAAREIDDEIPPGADPAGYVYFHNQDTQRAVEGGPLLLGFGSFVDAADPAYPELAARIGHQVVAALAAHGLHAEWDGSPDRRIAVHLTWQNRLPADPVPDVAASAAG